MRAEPTANVAAEKLLDHFDWDELYLARCQVLSSLAPQKKRSPRGHGTAHTCERAGFDDVKWRCIDLHALFADSPRIFQSTLPQSRHVFCRQAPIKRGDFVQRTIKFRRVALYFSCYATRARTTKLPWHGSGAQNGTVTCPRTVSPNGLIPCVSLCSGVFVERTT